MAGGWPEHAEAVLPRSDPGSQGVAAAGLLDLVDALDRHEGLHGLVVVRHGHVVAEGWWKPYDAATPHSLYSLSKSFTATAVGLAGAGGRLAVA
ncbi:MAG: serine hydrolase, partial [Planctomycetia bacterium]